MSDAGLREAERRWRETGAVEDEARLIIERVRVGELTRGLVELAAYCGSDAARAATGILPGPPAIPPGPADDEPARRSLVAWLRGLRAVGQAPWVLGIGASLRPLVAVSDPLAAELARRLDLAVKAVSGGEPPSGLAPLPPWEDPCWRPRPALFSVGLVADRLCAETTGPWRAFADEALPDPASVPATQVVALLREHADVDASVDGAGRIRIHEAGARGVGPGALPALFSHEALRGVKANALIVKPVLDAWARGLPGQRHMGAFSIPQDPDLAYDGRAAIEAFARRRCAPLIR